MSNKNNSNKDSNKAKCSVCHITKNIKDSMVHTDSTETGYVCITCALQNIDNVNNI